MTTKRQEAFDNDGMNHYYSTCPTCHCIVADENIVFVDGAKTCRECIKQRGTFRDGYAEAEQRALTYQAQVIRTGKA